MNLRQKENIKRSQFNPNELWMKKKLDATRFKFTRQAMWGMRLFDFWCHDLGIAVEVDGPEHNKKYDSYRDEYSFRRSAVVVLRVRNLNELDAEFAISFINQSNGHLERKVEIGIKGNTKHCRTRLAKMPYPPSMLEEYIKSTIKQST